MIYTTHGEAVIAYGAACAVLGMLADRFVAGRRLRREYQDGYEEGYEDAMEEVIYGDGDPDISSWPASRAGGDEIPDEAGNLPPLRSEAGRSVPHSAGREHSSPRAEVLRGTENGKGERGPDDYVTGGWEGPEPGDRLYDQVNGTSTYADSTSWRDDMETRFADLVAGLHESWAEL